MTNKISDAVAIWMGFGFSRVDAERMEAETQRAIPTDAEGMALASYFAKRDEDETFDKAQEDC